MALVKRISTVTAAYQYDGTLQSAETIHRAFAGFYVQRDTDGAQVYLRLHTANGTAFAYRTDWVIKDAGGFPYPCRDDIFKATFEILEP